MTFCPHISHNFMLKVRKQVRQRKKYHISLICGIFKKKKDTNELLYKTETDSQISKSNVVTKGKCGGKC